MKKMTVLIIAFIVCAAAAAAIYFFVGRSSADPSLLGSWTETGRASQPDTLTIEKRRLTYASPGSEQTYSYKVVEGDGYSLGIEDTRMVTFPDEAPYCGELVYHTQQVDGHEIRILDSFMYEDDGRGMIVFMEFVHNDDLQYVPDDFCSDLYHEYNDSEAQPTYQEAD